MAALFDAAGVRHGLQARVLDRWSDHSVRWLLLDFFADHAGGAADTVYELRFGESSAPAPQTRACVATPEGGGFVVDTGRARFRVSDTTAAALIADAVVAGDGILDGDQSGLVVQDHLGDTLPLSNVRITLEDPGPLRTVVRVDGLLGEAGRTSLKLITHLHFLAGSASVQVFVTLRNPRRATHPGGLWELGDPGSILLRDVTWKVTLRNGQRSESLRCSAEAGMPAIAAAGTVELFQASSGGANWQSTNHVNRDGIVPLGFKGYRLLVDGRDQTNGDRATPIVELAGGALQVALSAPDFWENFPKAIEANRDSLALRLFPHQHGDLHELQGGEQKTHMFWVAFDRDTVSDPPLEWTRSPLLPHLDPAAYAQASAVSYLTPLGEQSDPELGELIAEALDGEESFAAKQERLDEFGWRNFGDLYADHETRLPGGVQLLISHYNNQYDGIAAFATQFMRSNDPRWWRLFTTLATHVADIDVYHTDQDKSAFNHGLFWHTSHYTDAGKSSHRSFPRAPGIFGGGPSNEHNYSTGLMLHHFMTGDPMSREAAIGLGRWTLDMDDGRKTVFRVLASGDTGLASATASESYHGPGRGAGNSINTLLNAHRLTGDAAFLQKAETLIRRCIHPQDDIASRNLLDPEPRWSYTVFLSALGNYLDRKQERGEIDRMFAYARASLLAYATWMATHERPYLDHPEVLEFPNETWAAQELWKVRTFLFAASHSENPHRATFLERAHFFFRYSMKTLRSMETRALARPLVLVAGQGYMIEYFDRHPELAAPVQAPRAELPPSPRFVPQKARAKKRFVVLAAVGGATALAAAGALILALLG